MFYKKNSACHRNYFLQALEIRNYGDYYAIKMNLASSKAQSWGLFLDTLSMYLETSAVQPVLWLQKKIIYITIFKLVKKKQTSNSHLAPHPFPESPLKYS